MFHSVYTIEINVCVRCSDCPRDTSDWIHSTSSVWCWWVRQSTPFWRLCIAREYQWTWLPMESTWKSGWRQRTGMCQSYLYGLSATHGMCKNAAETSCFLKALQRFNDVIIHETYAADLMWFEIRAKVLGYVQIRIIIRMIDIDQNIAWNDRERELDIRVFGAVAARLSWLTILIWYIDSIVEM